MRRYVRWVVVCALIGACSDDESGGGGDVSADQAGDGGTDVLDTGPDTSDADSGDAAGDTAADSGDAAGDTAADAPADAAPDAPVDGTDDGLADGPGHDALPDGGETGRVLEHVGTPCDLELRVADLALGTTLDVLNGAVWVEQNAEAQVAAHALTLVGTDRISAGAAFLIAPCTETTEYIPFCEPMEDLEGGVRCSQIACEDAGIQLVHAWFNQGVGTDTTRDERATLSYPLETSPGTVTYDPNPVLTWRSDLSGDPNVMGVELDNAVTVSFDDGPTVDFSHTGTAGVIRPVGDEGTVTTSLVFSALAESALEMTVTLDTEGSLGGLVLRGEDELATIEATSPDHIVVTWTCP